jgi:hypothetical protein
MLADERAFKALLGERLRKATVPAEVRAAIHNALNGVRGDRAEAAGPTGRLSVIGAERLRPRMWAPLAALAAAVILVVMARNRSADQALPSDLDVVVDKFSSFEKHFEPNVPSESIAAVAIHYHSAKMPAFIWNFEPVGFHLVGGRIDRLPDGRPATYTFYRGPKGAILCTRYHAAKIAIPPGGQEIHPDQYAYSYKGYSVVLTVMDRSQGWLCWLVSRVAAAEFNHDVSLAEGET